MILPILFPKVVVQEYTLAWRRARPAGRAFCYVESNTFSASIDMDAKQDRG
ncbi:MAG: hypothetical protein V3U38_00775 [Gemmatimonadota bacterium]